jgi:hypothetical protein
LYYGHPDWEHVQTEEMRYHNSSVTPDGIHETADDTKSFFRDARIADHAVAFLQELNAESLNAPVNDSGQPWFLSVGFKGTHMQYQMPKRYWDAYSEHTFPLDDEEDMETTTDNTLKNDYKNLIRTSHSYHPVLTYPRDAPHSGHVTSAESRYIMYMKGEGTEVGDDREPYQRLGEGRSISTRGWEELYRGYLACLTYMDAQLGRILDEMDKLDLWQNTIVIFTSDHGMHVGEKGMWSKWSLFDEATRVPLLFHDPISPGSDGQRYAHPVELLDLFPTIAEMTKTSLDTSSCEDSIENKVAEALTDMDKRVFRHRYCDELDGVSLRPIFTDMNSQFLEAELHGNQQKNIQSTFRKPLEFALTQKQSCISQGIMKRLTKMPPSAASAGFFGNTATQLDSIDEKMIDPYGEGWLDFCPFKVAPEERNPGYGLMGYSMRTIDWRYTAWILLDVNTLLPALDAAPLAEELYDHRVSENIPEHNKDDLQVRSIVGKNELINLFNSTAENGFYQDVRKRLRRSLYDYLYYNATYEHLFHGRVQEQVDMLQELHQALGKPLTEKNVRKQRDGWNNIVANRIHAPHPHWTLYNKHFYSE